MNAIIVLHYILDLFKKEEIIPEKLQEQLTIQLNNLKFLCHNDRAYFIIQGKHLTWSKKASYLGNLS